MKKLVLFAALVFLGSVATYGQFKVGFGLGYITPTTEINDVLDSGISGQLELGYGVTDNLDVSLLLMLHRLRGGDVLSPFSSFAEIEDLYDLSYLDGDMASAMIQGRYYLTKSKSKFKFYVGLGLGVTQILSLGYKSGNTYIPLTYTATNFSFRPMVGFTYGVLNVNLAYLHAGAIGPSRMRQSVGGLSLNVGLLFNLWDKKR
ncbi:hypothetical protein [Spongiimicrobium sp. 3-5]|uniref:hypothetical protein n=1 Tax=Spongiimicrobium sp. 3-5 TaxID=3332596 RepID=UPI00397FA936